MRMCTKILCLFFLIAFMDCRKLTEKENMALKESCGRGKKALSHPRKQVFKAFGGQPVEQDELPFMATLRYSRGELMEMCGGSLISPYHVLTAAHCVMQFNFDELCNNRSKRKTADLKFNNNLKDWKIYIGSSCPIPELCMKPRKVSKFFYLRDYHPCNQGSDLAIFHLKKKVLPEEAVPICIAERDEEVNVLVYSAGTGFDPEKGEDEEQDHELQKVSLFRAKEFDDQIAVVDKESSLCGGDSGGPLFQTSKTEQQVQFGVAATVDPECGAPHQYMTTYFTDVRKHLDWICVKTGVCPKEDYVDGDDGSF